MVVDIRNERLCIIKIDERELKDSQNKKFFNVENIDGVLKYLAPMVSPLREYLEFSGEHDWGILSQQVDKSDDTRLLILTALSSDELEMLDDAQKNRICRPFRGSDLSARFIKFVDEENSVDPIAYLEYERREKNGCHEDLETTNRMMRFESLDNLMRFFGALKLQDLPIYHIRQDGDYYCVIAKIKREEAESLSLCLREYEDSGEYVSNSDIQWFMSRNKKDYVCQSDKLIQLIEGTNIV